MAYPTRYAGGVDAAQGQFSVQVVSRICMADAVLYCVVHTRRSCLAADMRIRSCG